MTGIFTDWFGDLLQGQVARQVARAPVGAARAAAFHANAGVAGLPGAAGPTAGAAVRAGGRVDARCSARGQPARAGTGVVRGQQVRGDGRISTCKVGAGTTIGSGDIRLGGIGASIT
jgi:hypothetical protein